MNTGVQNENVSLRTIFEIIDLFKYKSVEGENVEIIVSPYEVDGKYDDSKRVVTIGQRGGFRRERETFVFDDAEEFDTVILPQILAYFSVEDKMGKWDVTTPEIKEATIKGLCETESGNVVYVATFNPELFDALDKGIEKVAEETSYKKAEYNDEDKAWKGILSYVKGRSELIDFTGYSLTEKEIEEFYRLVELMAQDGLTDGKVVFTTKIKETMEKIEELFKNPEPLLKNGFSEEFLEKIQKTVSLEQIAKLAINERKFINKFDKDNPVVLSKLKFSKVQLGGMKGKYFGSRNHAEVVNKLEAEYDTSNVYNQEEKDLYKKYCDELLGLIEKTKKDNNKVKSSNVDLDAPLKARRETTSYTDDYEMFSEIVDLVRLGKKDDEHYELIVEPDTKDPSKMLVRISLFDGVSRTDTFNFEFTDREEFKTRFRAILDRIYSEDPNFQTTVLYSNEPEVGERRQSLRITKDRNEILIKDAPEEFLYEKTKVVDINRDEPPTTPSMAETVNYEDDNKMNKNVEVVKTNDVLNNEFSDDIDSKKGAVEQAVNILDRYIAVKGAEEQAKNIIVQEEKEKAEVTTEARVETRVVPEQESRITAASTEPNRGVHNTPEPPTGPVGPTGPAEPKTDAPNVINFTSFEIENLYNDIIASREASRVALNNLITKKGRTDLKETFDLYELLPEVENIYDKYGLSIIVMMTKGGSKEEEELISKYRHLGIAYTNYYNLTAKRKDLTENEIELRKSVKEEIRSMYAFEGKYMSDERINEMISKIRKQRRIPPADEIFLSELREEKVRREKAIREEQKRIHDLRREANKAFEKLLPARRKYLKKKGLEDDNAKSIEFNEVVSIISSLYDQYGIPDATGELLTRKGAAREDRAMFNAAYDYYSLCVLYYIATADKEGLKEEEKEFREVAKEHIQLFDAMTAQKMSDEELDASIEKFRNNKDIKPVGALWLETLEKEKVRRSVQEKVARDKSLQFTMSPALQAALKEAGKEQAERIIISEGSKDEAERQVLKNGAIEEATTQVLKDGAKEEATRQVLKNGAMEEAERQVLKNGAVEEATRQVLSDGAIKEAERIVAEENEKKKTTNPEKEAAAAALLSGILAAIKAQEKEKEKNDAITDTNPAPVKDNKDTTVSFEQLYEYTKKYKISNNNGPLEIFYKDSGEKYVPVDEAEKRNIEFAFYWGVMVGKNDKYNTEVVNMDYAYSEENKKLFDIMDVHFKESLRKGIDIDFESLERQFINSGVANAEDIFDSLFKTDPLRDYVVKYYKDSLGLEDEKEKVEEKEEVKSEAEEYAEYRKLFELNSEFRLAPIGKGKLNTLRNKEGAIGELELANRERFISLYKKMTNVNSKEADEEYKEKQEQYNRLKRKYDTEYAEQIKAYSIPDDHILPTYDNKFYELLDETKDRDGMQIVLSDDTKALFEYIALDKERLSRQLTEAEESRMIELVQTNERARILEFARILVNTKGMQVLKLKILQGVFKERIEEELKNAKWIPKEEDVERVVTPEVPEETPVVGETPTVEPEEKEADKVKRLDLSKDDRDFADYLKLVTARKMRKLSEEEENKLAELVSTNERAGDLEKAKEEYRKGELSKEALQAMHDEYAAQFAEAIKNAIVIIEDAEKEEKHDTPSEEKNETIPEDLVPYYEQVKKFEENAAKYSMERVDGEIKFYDRETNIEYIPRNRSVKAELEFGQHWMNSVGNDDLIENAKMYKLLHTTYMDSFGKGNLNVPELREQFVASGVPNADICFDNLFADNKNDFMRDHIADMEALSQYERENGVITIDFQEMKELLKKYAINGNTGSIVERNDPHIIGPGEYQDDVAMGEWISDTFGERKEDERDLTVFDSKSLLEKFKLLIKEIKNLIFDSFKFNLNEDREAIIEAMKNYEGGEEFASALIPNDVYMSILIDYVAEKYHMDNPKKTQEYYDYVLNGGKTKDETPVPEQPTEMLRLLPGTEPLRLYPGGGESLTEAAKQEPEHEELPPADGTDSEKLNEEEKDNSKTEVVEEFPTETKEYDKETTLEPVKADETTNQALRRLQDYMSATYEFNLGQGVPTAIKLRYENGKSEVGEVIFTTGDVNSEQILFQQKFTQEDINTKVLPVIASKYVELNNDVEKLPAYTVQGRKNTELFYLGSEEENLFQVSNASKEVLDLAEQLMDKELAKKQGLNKNDGLRF